MTGQARRNTDAWRDIAIPTFLKWMVAQDWSTQREVVEAAKERGFRLPHAYYISFMTEQADSSNDDARVSARLYKLSVLRDDDELRQLPIEVKHRRTRKRTKVNEVRFLREVPAATAARILGMKRSTFFAALDKGTHFDRKTLGEKRYNQRRVTYSLEKVVDIALLSALRESDA